MTIKPRVIFLFVLIFCLKAGFCAAQKSSETFTGRINADAVNVRSGPHTNFEIINKMNKDELVLVLDQEGEWYKIQLPRKSSAYIHRRFLGPLTAHGLAGTINADRVNIRAGKGTNFNVLGQFNKNDRAEIVGRAGEWIKIYPAKTVPAWVHKDYVVKTAPAAVFLEKEKTAGGMVVLLEKAEEMETRRAAEKNGASITAVIAAYKKIIDRCPDGAAAAIARQRINILAGQISSPPAEPPRDEVSRKPALPAEPPAAEGKILASGRFLNRPGTHKLHDGKTAAYFLKSASINLNQYLNRRVSVWGSISPSDTARVPVIEVEAVKIIE